MSFLGLFYKPFAFVGHCYREQSLRPRKKQEIYMELPP